MIFFSVLAIFREVIIFSRTQQSGKEETISEGAVAVVVVTAVVVVVLLLHEQNYLSGRLVSLSI